ncbi:tRNA 2-thiouridine(34) synthase MnmA [Candidatus Kapabacteria bacterium]|nr:tRNA 2-thiouridine(34) synthase MnmA [Candidatus Kapabacteria bacterium]
MENLDNKKIVVGLSGGVDSSVAAFLLKDTSNEVSAIFMQNWNDTTGILDGECHWEDDLDFAQLISNQLNIPLSKVDLSEEYRKRIVDYMFSEYDAGRTPNPDILCNREIKFDVFLDIVLESGAEYVATGHYCGKSYDKSTNEYKLLSGIDSNKDQSYFLSQLNQYQLSKAIFPISEILKEDVRKIAKQNKLATHSKKDSQGLCFIGKVDLPTFLKQKLIPRSGDVIEISNEVGLDIVKEIDFTDHNKASKPYNFTPNLGDVIGRHKGVQFYTIGQRKGLGLGGFPKPLFVLHIDNKENIIYVGQGLDHPLLKRKGLFIKSSEVHWIRPSQKMELNEQRNYKVRFRHRQALQDALLIQNKDSLIIYFNEFQEGISPGQFAAWYDGRECLGSGPIS